ncbi:hypothetical protein [Polynucleobacter necessarius]|uniref:hypothetical protein n=1 Tax=Polynucleobacter necessarius TaxID=576610 RepID=UPI0013B0623F|nr:hypothetical protein [Polynucleobacter necessarius]
MKKIIAFIFCAFAGAGSVVMAALPPLTPKQAEAAALTKAKVAYGDRMGAYQLCQAQNRSGRLQLPLQRLRLSNQSASNS